MKSPWFGVNLDTGNFHSPRLYDELAEVAPYALNVQVKVNVSTDGGAHERADFQRLAKILRDAQYRGYIVLELETDEKKEPPRTACPQYIDQIRTAFA